MSGAGGPTGSRRDESNGQARTGEPSGSWRADGVVVQVETERSRADKRGAGAETAQVEVRDAKQDAAQVDVEEDWFGRTQNCLLQAMRSVGLWNRQEVLGAWYFRFRKQAGWMRFWMRMYRDWGNPEGRAEMIGFGGSQAEVIKSATEEAQSEEAETAEWAAWQVIQVIEAMEMMEEALEEEEAQEAAGQEARAAGRGRPPWRWSSPSRSRGSRGPSPSSRRRC